MSAEYNGGVSLSRKLTGDESKELRDQLSPILANEGSGEAEDISDFLEYAFAMVSNGKTVDHVIQELLSMEMDFCPQPVADQIGKALSEFLTQLDGAEGGAANAEDGGNHEDPTDEADEAEDEAKGGSRVASLKVRADRQS
jgi:hypothetical protein